MNWLNIVRSSFSSSFRFISFFLRCVLVVVFDLVFASVNDGNCVGSCNSNAFCHDSCFVMIPLLWGMSARLIISCARRVAVNFV